MDQLLVFLLAIAGHLCHHLYPQLWAARRAEIGSLFGSPREFLIVLGIAVVVSAVTLPIVEAFVTTTAGVQYVIAFISGWSIRGLISPVQSCTCRK
ncbi:hypothetical protein ACIPPR_19525 [Streptomyces nigra]|uniref:hypothetical protein n=1 Tax=Streptomyces nigra TaxID=1827580 RepID=UPI0037FD073B